MKIQNATSNAYCEKSHQKTLRRDNQSGFFPKVLQADESSLNIVVVFRGRGGGIVSFGGGTKQTRIDGINAEPSDCRNKLSSMRQRDDTVA